MDAARAATWLGRAGWWVALGDTGWCSARRGPLLGWAARAGGGSGIGGVRGAGHYLVGPRGLVECAARATTWLGRSSWWVAPSATRAVMRCGA
ncbi:unnamed protein product [Linum trigynum]|uniref:Uncharacterized protein n=1 Tax=Linum trigynum TaxID=586398 RepID=A0AAV2GSV8_9ROSI